MSNQRRNFNRSEHQALYEAANGQCEICGKSLSKGWHADHVHPYSRGGNTDLVNGQALCPECNLKKGSSMAEVRNEQVTLREFQERFVDIALGKAEAGKRTLVADVHAGSGKTLAACVAADRLMAAGYVNQVVVFVPRVNLAAQFELDWKSVRHNLEHPPVMRDINHRPNEYPLILKNADGYISTYSSLVTNPRMHLRQIQSYKTLVIFDEADRLGADFDTNDFTLSAKWADEVGKVARFVFVMSGTPIRADGSPLLFAEYDEPDNTGFRRLRPDVSATYRDGVRDGYLRRFDFRLVDGTYTLVKLDGTTDTSIQRTEATLGRVLLEPDIWKPMLDTFVERLEFQKNMIDNRLCGLIAANNQNHARAIADYMRKTYPRLKTLIAVSDDGTEAQENLKRFKSNSYDVLITVSMAYIGYDHKPISVLLLLTSFRTEAYLRQLVARGLRMWSAVPKEKQSCLVIAPDDPRMSEFVHALRSESEWGYEQQFKITGENTPKDMKDPQQPELAYIINAVISDMRAMGLDPSGDLTSGELRHVQRILDRLGYPYPASDMMAFIQAFSNAGAVNFQPVKQAQSVDTTRTSTERLQDVKRELKKAVGRFANVYHLEYNEIYGQLSKVYRLGTKHAKSIEEIEARIHTVMRWTEQGFYDDEK